MQKVTIKEQFVEVAEVLRGIERADLAEFIEGRIAILDKKSESKKATAKQVENEGIKSDILANLANRANLAKLSKSSRKPANGTLTRITAIPIFDKAVICCII